MSIQIQTYYDINPSDPTKRRDVLHPDFIEKFAIMKQLIIEEGSLLINKYDSSSYKIHVIPTNIDGSGIIIEHATNPTLSLKNTLSSDTANILKKADNVLQINNNANKLLEIFPDKIQSIIPFYSESIHSDNYYVGTSPLNTYLNNYTQDILNQSKLYTDQQILLYNNTIVGINFVQLNQLALQTILGPLQFDNIQYFMNDLYFNNYSSHRLLFVDDTKKLQAANTLVYDSVNIRLGINNASPETTLHINGGIYAGQSSFIPNTDKKHGSIYYNETIDKLVMVKGNCNLPAELWSVYNNVNKTIFDNLQLMLYPNISDLPLSLLDYTFNNYNFANTSTTTTIEFLNPLSTPAVSNYNNSFAWKFNGSDSYIELPAISGGLNLDYSLGLTINIICKWSSFNNNAAVFDLGCDINTDNIRMNTVNLTNELQVSTFNGSAESHLTLASYLTEHVWYYMSIALEPGAPGDLVNATWIVGRLTDLVNTLDGYATGIDFKVIQGQLYLPKTVIRTKNYIGKSTNPTDGFFNGNVALFQIYNKYINNDITYQICNNMIKKFFYLGGDML